MKKRNSESVLIATWTMSQDPTVDLPATVKWEDGRVARASDYVAHLDDTFEWVEGEMGQTQKRIYPSVQADVKYDNVAGVWFLSGKGVTTTALDLTDPEVADDQIIAELYSFPKVYRARIHRPAKKSVDAVNPNTSGHHFPHSASLFWIASFERRHDWLIFAETMRCASAHHREEIHCSIDSRHCHRVLQRVRPFPFHSGEAPCYATNDDLVQLGFRVLESPAGIQAVRLGIATYVEGYQFSAIPEIRDDNAEAASGNRPSGTKRHLPPLQF